MSIFLSLLGGLGLFLFGMKMMSEGLEKAAGAKLRNILEVMTKNRLVGVLVGTVFTAIIQSSSAATVMVVSFVNAGLMTLTQAAGVIMGANIGTTVTSQLVSLDLSEIAPLFLFVGVIMVMFLKKPMVKKIGEVVLGFGILFMGLSLMSGSMESLKDSPAVVGTLSSLKNPLLAVVVGMLVTAVVQSSSVTVSIILVMATQGLLALPICFFTILGCNIGACVSALLASVSGKKDAKRAAMIHFSFNVIGTILIAIILAVGMDQVESLIRAISGNNPGRCVANAHTIFKIFQVIILFPFAGWLVKLVNFLVPGQDNDAEGFQLKYIGKTAVFSPTTAAVETIREIEGMGELAIQNLQDSIDAFFQKDSQRVSKVYDVEKKLDFLCKEITDYLVKINQKEQLPLADSVRIGGLFHVVNDIERIGDHAENFADAAVSSMEDGLEFTKKGTRELRDMYDKVREILAMSLEMFSTGKKEHLEQILALENEIDEMERSLQKSHVRRLAKGKCTAQAGVIYTDMVTGLERVADHATNIAFSILDEDPEEDFEL
ncbi:MAG: Na/Pi cotransporter family protein [Lachnospiraceae bacterium]|nr:Na/Pi cotransporter family protein [Lachnospiraceae bacterium]